MLSGWQKRGLRATGNIQMGRVDFDPAFGFLQAYHPWLAKFLHSVPRNGEEAENALITLQKKQPPRELVRGGFYLVVSAFHVGKITNP